MGCKGVDQTFLLLLYLIVLSLLNICQAYIYTYIYTLLHLFDLLTLHCFFSGREYSFIFYPIVSYFVAKVNFVIPAVYIIHVFCLWLDIHIDYEKNNHF